MTSRLPAIGLTAGLFLATAALPAQQPAAPAAGSDPKSVTDLRSPQEQNAELFRKFQRELLALAQKLERSDRPEDKARAKVIHDALDLSRKENLDSQFQKMIAAMGRGGGNVGDIDTVLGQDRQLNKALQEILTLLMTDDESARTKAEIASLQKYLAETRAILRAQQTIRAITDAQRGDPNRTAKEQKDLADRTKDLADRMGGKKDAGNKSKENGAGGKEGTPQSEPKADEKPGDAAGDGKSDTQESKADAKAAGGDPMKAGGEAGAEAKPGAKDGKPTEGGADKAGAEAKPGEQQAGTPRGAGDPKDGANPKKGSDSDPKAGGGEPKPGDPKTGGEPGGKSPDGKPGESAGEPGGSKNQGQGKGQDKAAGQKGGDAKGKNDAGQKSDAQQASAKGGQQQGGQPSGQQGQQQAGQPQGQQPPQLPGRKQVQEAYPHQQGATDDLKKNDRPAAGKNEDKAIAKLEEAAKELEKRLKQLREEETLKLLANLEARCGRMLALQIEVFEVTKAIDGVVIQNGGKKTTAEIQKAQQQGDKEAEIVAEAGRALKLLESEGSAVAFARVLEEVRQDMTAAQRRLGGADVGKDTQAIEENVIAMLKEMVAALKKAQQDTKQQQQQQQQSAQQKPGNQNLIDLLAELRLIRSLQMQVNARTKMHGDKTPGEQAADPFVQGELRQLSERQAKLQEMVTKIATGENR